jgi:predicted GTPase
MKKTYLLVGITGSGKSTTGNCIFNRSASYEKISITPFATSDSATGCTRKFMSAVDDRAMILDTVGFGDPQFDSKTIFEEFKKALQLVNNEIDCVCFVVKKGRFSNEIVQFFEIVQEKVLKNKCKDNSLLIVTDCNKGWIDREDQRKNEFIQRALKNCSNLSYEFFLNFDQPNDEEEDIKRNFEKRQKSINKFVDYLDNLRFEKVNLEYVQSFEFEQDWNNSISPSLITLMTEMLKSIKDEARESRESANRLAQQYREESNLNRQEMQRISQEEAAHAREANERTIQQMREDAQMYRQEMQKVHQETLNAIRSMPPPVVHVEESGPCSIM